MAAQVARRKVPLKDERKETVKKRYEDLVRIVEDNRNARELPPGMQRSLDRVLGELTAAVKEELFPNSSVKAVFVPVDCECDRPYAHVILVQEEGSGRVGVYDADEQSCHVEDAPFLESRIPREGPSGGR
jgi:hypothetical protein